ncbi:MAG: hypothetical protein IKU32_06505 [Clostridia bacterium]|nr:hypothetical protein [Clostridia bacterium]
MYQSPVPLIVIRSAAHSLIEVNGQILGECLPGSHVAMPAGDTGDYYISSTPLEGTGWPTTRKLTLSKGAALPPEGDSVELCAWPGGVYELSFAAERSTLRPADIPRQLDQLSFSCGRSRRTLTLYYEGGLRLLIEDEGRSSCISLGQGDYGTLALYTAAGRQFAAVITHEGHTAHLLMLDSNTEAVLEITADEILLEQDCIAAIDNLGTIMGHQRKRKFIYSAGEFSADHPETGFFTREYSFPVCKSSLVRAFAEAVREGFREEAMSYLTPDLRQSLPFDEIRDFLGNFQSCRPPLSDKSGALLGLITSEGNRVSSARLYEFQFENGLISDIAEV